MPRALPVLTVAALAVALVGCSGEPDNASTPETDTTAQQCVASGAQSDAVKVSGELGYGNLLDLPAVAVRYDPSTAPGLF